MRTIPMLLALATAVMAAACTGSLPGGDGSSGNGTDPGGNGNGNGSGPGGEEQEHTVLDDREVDYNEALRTASLKLVRALPTLAQIKKVQNAADQKAAYEEELDAMLQDPRFTARMVKWWRDVMRQGGGAGGNGEPSRDTAPTFATRVMIEEQPYTNLFTATANTCPTYDEAANTFADGECNNNVPAHAGVLTNPGVMYQFYGNMAFRRVRWVQEIFVCTKHPAEYSATPVKMGAGEYTSPWEFASVATKPEPVDFQDTASVICANCHGTMNHQAPLFANFDMNGMWQDTIQVVTPSVPEPIPSELRHWLRDGETTAWRNGEPVANLTELGEAMAADPDVHECAVARMWNFAMSKEDIVTDLATVPPPFIAEFTESNYNLKQVLRSMLTSDDFIKF
jgi:hypothetical protein